nr:retrovirus-related Pol polyprotein from transposon TNT 1-94 [Tanacetum cinerariifolium]
FDGAFRGVEDEEVVVGEGWVVESSSLEMLTNSCLGGIMVSFIFLEGLVEEALEEFMVELFEEDDKRIKKWLIEGGGGSGMTISCRAMIPSRIPSIGFMRPFGCHVTILNTLDPLGKFNGKADEGFVVRYSVSSKAFRVFNSRTKIVQETLHMNFLENQPNVAGSGPTWLSDIDTLTQSINYQPLVVGNQPNSSTCIQGNFDACKVVKAAESTQQYVLLPLWSTGSKDPYNTDADAACDDKENESGFHVSLSSSGKPKKHNEKAQREAKGKSHVELSTGVRDLSDKFEAFSDHITNRVNAAFHVGHYLLGRMGAS